MDQKIKKQLKSWGLIIALLALFVFIVIGLATAGGGGQTELTDSEWIKGNPEASLSLIEYSDFQCPACAYYFPFIQQLNEEMGDSVKIVYRHFPLATLHPNATAAAWAAEAAGLQNNFWEMHDLLFERQTSWSSLKNPEDTFAQYAQELNLNVDQFKKDIDSKTVKDAVRQDVASGNQAGVRGTPSFYLDGSKINNPGSYDELRQLIQEKQSAQ